MTNPAVQPRLAAATEMMREHRGLFRALAISWIVLGILSILAPLAAGVAVALVVAWTLLLGGFAQLVHAFRARPWRGAGLSFLWALANMVAGVLLLTRPLQSVLTLTAILAIFLLWEGVAKIVLAFRIRPHPSWSTFLLSGGLALVLGFLLFSGLPGTATWALGTFVGINMIFGGIALWRFASHAA